MNAHSLLLSQVTTLMLLVSSGIISHKLINYKQ